MRGMVGNDEEETRYMGGNDEEEEEEEEERLRGVVHWQVVKKKKKTTCRQTSKAVLSSGLLGCNICFVLFWKEKINDKHFLTFSPYLRNSFTFVAHTPEYFCEMKDSDWSNVHTHTNTYTQHTHTHIHNTHTHTHTHTLEVWQATEPDGVGGIKTSGL